MANLDAGSAGGAGGAGAADDAWRENAAVEYAVFMKELDQDGKGLISGPLAKCRDLGKALHHELWDRIDRGACGGFPPGSSLLAVVREANGSDPQGDGPGARPGYWGLMALAEAIHGVGQECVPGLEDPDAVVRAADEADDVLASRSRALWSVERESFVYPRDMLGGSLDSFSPAFQERLSRSLLELCVPAVRKSEGWVWASDILADGSEQAEMAVREAVEGIAEGDGDGKVKAEAGALLKRMQRAAEAAAGRDFEDRGLRS